MYFISTEGNQSEVAVYHVRNLLGAVEGAYREMAEATRRWGERKHV